MTLPLPPSMENLVKVSAEHPVTEDILEEHKRSPISFTCLTWFRVIQHTWSSLSSFWLIFKKNVYSVCPGQSCPQE